MVELIINDKKVTVEEGTTILAAAKKIGIAIPNMCYDKRLRPYGGCRLCVVEQEGNPRLLASCSTPVSPGMVIKTETPKLKKARQTVLELLLIHHPLDCPVCDKAGECDLQDIAYEYGKPEGRFIRHRKTMNADVRGPLVELTANRCILCGKCVRICSEHQGRGALGLIGRGFPTVVQPAFGEILECDYCGQCIDICPTGALLSKPMKFQARAWFLEEKDTICPFCSCGCTLTIGTREGKILRSRAKEDNGRSEGNLCGRGRFGVDYIYSENRLKTPLVRKDGELVPATWDQALKYAADSLANIIAASGSTAIGAIGSHRCTNEDNYMLRKFMSLTIGSGNLDSSAAFGYTKVQKALTMAFGTKAHPIDMKAPLGKEVILIVESDISITHPVFGLNILKAKREGAKLLVVDSRDTKLTRHSTSHLRIHSGSALVFLNGLMKTIIDHNLFDRNIVSKAEGFEAFEKGLAGYTAEKVERLIGIPAADLIETAQEIAKAKSRMISLTISAAENTKGMNTVLAAANLAILLGDGPEALQIPAEYANTYGMQKAGIIPETGSRDIFSMLYEQDALRGLIIMGEDPLTAFPFSSKIQSVLKSLDLLIVQDIALTETAKMAHIVLPAAAWAEKDGTFTNAEGVTQKLQRIVDSQGQALPDWQILRNLSLAMGKEVGTRSVEGLMQEIGTTAKQEQGIAGIRVLHDVRHADEEIPSAEYPLSLAIRDVLQHSGSMSTRSKSLDLVVSEPYLEVSEDDATKLGVIDNGHVKVSSRRGTIYLKAKVTDNVPMGTVFASTHFPHGRVNTLLYYPENGTAGTCAVKVESVKR